MTLYKGTIDSYNKVTALSLIINNYTSFILYIMERVRELPGMTLKGELGKHDNPRKLIIIKLSSHTNSACASGVG